MFKVETLTKCLGANAVVDRASFALDRSMMVGVIGRSGAGKSTPLRMINRLVNGTRIREVAAESLAIGQVVQARPGDRIPADGTFVSGTAGVDESPVTARTCPR